MATTNCPKCKKSVTDTDKTCPHCGANVSLSLFSKEAPLSRKLHNLSTLIMAISAALLIVEIADIAKTYVGGILLGIGFLLEGVAQGVRDKEEKCTIKSKAKMIMVFALVIMAASVAFLILDLR